MNIGGKIKELRIKKEFTQEQLADYINVSVSAVSQWESGKTMPDVSIILSLANLFDVSLDELFDRKGEDKEKDIAEYYKKSQEYNNQGRVMDNLSLWREAVKKYPSDFHCMIQLAYALYSTIHACCDCGGENTINKNAKECIAICERILKDCTDDDIRSSAIQYLVYTYSNGDFDFSSEEKAQQYAQMAQSIVVSREALMEFVYFKKESAAKKREIKQSNILYFMDGLTMKLYYGKYDCVSDKIKACNAALKLWEILIYDGNYLFYHCRLEKIYLLLAYAYAEQLDKENTIASLKKALYHAESFDSLPTQAQSYTGVFVNSVICEPSQHIKNYTFTDKDDILKHTKSKKFDFLRQNEDFLMLLNS